MLSLQRRQVVTHPTVEAHPVLKSTRTVATYTRNSGEHYAMVEERRTYLGRPSQVSYRLEQGGEPVFHSPQRQPVAGVLVGLMLEDAAK